MTSMNIVSQVVRITVVAEMKSRDHGTNSIVMLLQPTKIHSARSFLGKGVYLRGTVTDSCFAILYVMAV